MTGALIAGFFTVIGAILGVCGTLFVQLELRKEKFKEVIYKEKLIAHQELLDCLWKLQTSLIDLRLVKDAGIPQHRNEHTELIEFTKKSEEFSNCLASRGLVISESVGAKATQLWLECVEECRLPGQDIDTMDPAVQFRVIKENHKAVVDAIRDELEIPEIEESIRNTFAEQPKSVLGILKGTLRHIFVGTPEGIKVHKGDRNG